MHDRRKGIRLRKLHRGEEISLKTVQINTKLIKEGKTTLDKAICTRDDIMNDLIAKGVEPFTAFKIMEKVRKGKGLSTDDVKVMKENKVEDWYIESCKKIKYMFPKAHAVAYVLNAFRIAFCKVHYPVEFYATYFTVSCGGLDPITAAKGSKAIREKMQEILQDGGRRNLTANSSKTLSVLEVALEMAERGFKLRPIDIYKSLSGKCVIEDGEVIPPLTSFPGLGGAAAESLVEARKNEKFSSREDLIQRTNVNRTTVEKMAAEGLLEGMPASDQMDMWEMVSEPNAAQASRLEENEKQKTEDGGRRTEDREQNPENLQQEPEIQKEPEESEDQGFLF